MKKAFIIITALLALCFVFTACRAEPGDNTADGVIGGGANTISNRSVTNDMTRSRVGVAARVRKAVDDYDRTRGGLYGGYKRGTVGRDYASGTGQSGSTLVRDRVTTNQGVVRNDFDTNPNLASEWNGSTETTNPIAPGGLVRNGSDNIE